MLVFQLTVVVSPRAEEQVEQIAVWLEQYGADTAARFVDAFQAEVTKTQQEYADRLAQGHPVGLVDETASLALSRPVFSRYFTTAQTRKRRSFASTYKIYYGLDDANGDGKADTLLVLRVQHAAAQPLWQEPTGEDNGKETPNQ